MKNGVFWDVTPLALVRTEVSEELTASIIRVTIIGELGTTLAVTSNRCTLRRNNNTHLKSYIFILSAFKKVTSRLLNSRFIRQFC
jgi:hypothetical protein